MNRLLVEIIVALAMLGAFTGYVAHWGAQNCARKDSVAEAHQETHNAAVTAFAVQTITIEKDAYVEAKLVPVPAGVVAAVHCVRDAAPDALPAPNAPGLGDHGGRGLSEGDSGSVQPITDISVPAANIGKNANAQVKQLKDYIRNVCLVRQ